MAAENTLHERSAMLHSLFELADGVSETEFRQAFEAFFGHLKAKGFAKCFRIMRRKHLEGFAAKLPTLEYYAAIEFHNLDCEQACYDYVAANAEPVRSLHHAMNSKAKRGAQFFVSADLA